MDFTLVSVYVRARPSGWLVWVQRAMQYAVDEAIHSDTAKQLCSNKTLKNYKCLWWITYVFILPGVSPDLKLAVL